MAEISSEQLTKLIQLFEASLKQMNSMTERFMGMAVASAAPQTQVTQSTTNANTTADEGGENSQTGGAGNYTVNPIFNESKRSKIKPRRPSVGIKTD